MNRHFSPALLTQTPERRRKNRKKETRRNRLTRM